MACEPIVFRNGNDADNLPYLDKPLTREQMEDVKVAISEYELTFPKRDYLADLVLPNMISEEEIQRLKSGKRTVLVFKSANLITQLQD